MSPNLKALIVVLALGVMVFAFVKPIALQFSAESDFKRRRNIWIILTVAAFLSPNIWLFALVATPVLYWGGKKDTHPLAFYLLLLNVVPPISRAIPTVGVKQLFDLDIFRILSFCVLIPAARQLWKSRHEEPIRGLQGMDLLLIAYGALHVFLFVPPDPAQSHYVILHSSFTNGLRTAFLFFVDVYVLFYVASRTSTNRRALLDALSAFVLSCSVMALVAVFESVKHWLLYTDLFARWGGDLLSTQYFVRTGLLRAEASSGQPLALAFLLTIAWGFWLYLRSRATRQSRNMGVTALLLIGLFVSFSRGPWLAALTLFLAFSAFGPRRGSGLFKAAIAVLVLGGLTLSLPIGARIAKMLPFASSKASDSSLVYREKLLDRSWQLIQTHPIFGDQIALSQMQDLRQGQGIIDVVNTYLGVTLFYGFAGLTLFVTFQLLPLIRARRIGKTLLESDPDSMLLGAAISATIVGTIVLLAASSLGAAPKCVFYVLIGFADAYWIASRSKGRANAPYALADDSASASTGGSSCYTSRAQ